MAASRLSDLTALTGAGSASTDLVYVVDVSAGTSGSKKMTLEELWKSCPGGLTFNGASGSNVLTIADNQADALSVKEGSNAYLTFTTSDGAELINVKKTLKFGGSTGANIIALVDNLADGLSISEGANPYLTFVTTNSSEQLLLSKKTSLLDDTDLLLGTGLDAGLRFSTADASNNCLVLALDDTSQALHVTDKGAIATDWNLSATTDPNLYLHSNTTPATDYLRLGNHTGTAADIDVVGGTTLNLMIAGANAFVMTATALTAVAAAGFKGQGSTVAPLVPIAAAQALSGSGAVEITNYYTSWDTTGGGAGTLADGAQVGQLKKVQLIVDGGDGTLTPSNLSGGTAITFADAGDYAILMWNGSDWVALELGNAADGVTAPVLA